MHELVKTKPEAEREALLSELIETAPEGIHRCMVMFSVFMGCVVWSAGVNKSYSISLDYKWSGTQYAFSFLRTLHAKVSTTLIVL